MLSALSIWTISAALLTALIATAASAADHLVSNDAQLRAALNPSSGAQNGYTITFTADITLQGDLPIVQHSITVRGQNFSLSGQGKFRGLFVYAGTVQISDLTIKDAKAQGGNAGGGVNNGGGGGGGAGLGGALFVRTGANVTINNVNLQGSSAVGGNGGDAHSSVFFNAGGGGGGLGGDGGGGAGVFPMISPLGGGGGGFGAGARGAISPLDPAGAGIALTLPAGGDGGFGTGPLSPGRPGGANGGGGGVPGGGGGIGGQ
jgi:hypothetical protein